MIKPSTMNAIGRWPRFAGCLTPLSLRPLPACFKVRFDLTDRQRDIEDADAVNRPIQGTVSSTGVGIGDLQDPSTGRCFLHSPQTHLLGIQPAIYIDTVEIAATGRRLQRAHHIMPLAILND